MKQVTDRQYIYIYVKAASLSPAKATEVTFLQY